MLENYTDKISEQGLQSRWMQEMLKNEGQVDSSAEDTAKIPTWDQVVTEKGELNMTIVTE